MNVSADHLRTTSGQWRGESLLWQDEANGLPLQLGPFWMQLYGKGDWRYSSSGDTSGAHADPFDCFAAMFTAYRQWYESRPAPVVYFIGAALQVGAEVKIGHTTDVNRRLSSLQTCSAKPLQVFATTPGGRYVEQKYHRRWRGRRLGGEWFTLGDCIIDEIERLRLAPLGER